MKAGEDLKLSVDPLARMNSEVERYSELLHAGAIDQKTFDMAVAKSSENMERATKNTLDSLKASGKDASDSLNAVLIGFQTNVQSNLGNGIFQVLNGDFTNIGNAWKTMLLRMASDAAAANLANMIFGGGTGKGGGLLGSGLSILGSVLGAFGGGGSSLGNLFKVTSGALTGFAANGAYFDGHIAKFAKGDIFNSPTAFRFASGGALHNGIMGEAGPEAIMPLKRGSDGKLGVSGGSGKSIVIHNNQVINIDSRTDRASILQDIKKMNQINNAELMDKLERQGRI